MNASALQTALNSAAGGAVICVNNGTTGAITLTAKTYPSVVTVQPALGANVTIAGVTLNTVKNLRFTGVGSSDGTTATMTIQGNDIDESSGCSSNLSFDHITYTSGVLVAPKYACSHDLNLLWDHDRFDTLGQKTYEGRFNVQAYDTGPASPNGITISNSHFAGDGPSTSNCSDGIDALGGAYGTTIGPGNEFTNLPENTCSAHVDPIQFYGGTATLVTGNWFHDNGDGSGGIMSPDGDDGYTVTNNLFDQTGVYAYAVDVEGCTGCTVTHNVIRNANVFAGVSNAGSPTTNLTIRDNVFQNGGIGSEGTATYTATYNLNPGKTGTGNTTGTPIYQTTPTTGYYHYQLAPTCPGYNTASDNKSMGITP